MLSLIIVQEQHPELGHIEIELLDLLINREPLDNSIGEHIKQHQIPTVCLILQVPYLHILPKDKVED